MSRDRKTYNRKSEILKFKVVKILIWHSGHKKPAGHSKMFRYPPEAHLGIYVYNEQDAQDV